MKKIFIALLLIFSDIAYSTDTIVNKIFCNGLKRISLDTVLFHLPFQIGDIINDDRIANSIKKLFATGYFEEITIIDEDKGVIVIQVKERAMINNISFYGNKTIKSEDIKTKILDMKNIQSGALFNNCSIFEAKRELEDLCYNLGKFNAIVKIIITHLPRNRVDLKIMISEGKTAKVQQINIIGNHTFHNTRLLSQFTLNDKTIKWWKIFSSRKYQKQKLFHDLETLRSFYLNRGYAKFHIDSTKIEVSPDKKNVYLYLYITEGMQYLFDSVILDGNILNHLPNIKELIQINSGELYSIHKIQEIEHSIKYILGKNGYIQPNISIETDIDDCNKMVKLYVYIDIGNRFYVREIFFEGNNITKDLVMRREIHQIEQVQLDYTAILQDQERLNRLGYFKNVRTRIEYIPNILNQVNVIYMVEERNTGNLNLSVGIGTESGVSAQFGMCQENLLGTGNSVSITATKNHHQTYAEISALQSCYYEINKIKVSEKIFYNDFNTNNMDLSNYILKNHGININYLYSFVQNNTFNLGLNYMSNNLSKIMPQVTIWRYLNSIGVYPEILINNYFNNDINFHANDFLLVSGWILDNLNCVYFPTSGARVNILGKITLPGSSNQYYKITMDGCYFIPLDKDTNWILMSSVYAGYSGSIHKKESPFYDNFYAGGIGTIRGFRLNSVGPKATYYRCNSSDKSYTTCMIENSQDSIGGNAMVLFKTELIMPIIYFNKQYVDTTRISLFLDTGTVWDTFWKNTKATISAGITDYSISNNIRISSGVSLRWISPVGPVVFSYSKLLKRYLGDIEEPFQFSIGKTW